MSQRLFDMIVQKEMTKKKTAKQEKIIECAIRLFAEKGYANTSTAEIAKAAEVSEGTIFKHYGTKDQLLLSVVLPFIKEFFPMMTQEVMGEILKENSVSFEDFLRAFLRNRSDFLMENKEIFRVLVKEVMYRDEALRMELFNYFLQQVPPILGQIIEGFRARGEVVDQPPERILKTIAPVFGGFFVSRLVLFDLEINDQDIEDLVQMIIRGIGRRA